MVEVKDGDIGQSSVAQVFFLIECKIALGICLDRIRTVVLWNIVVELYMLIAASMSRF